MVISSKAAKALKETVFILRGSKERGAEEAVKALLQGDKNRLAPRVQKVKIGPGS